MSEIRQRLSDSKGLKPTRQPTRPGITVPGADRGGHKLGPAQGPSDVLRRSIVDKLKPQSTLRVLSAGKPPAKAGGPGARSWQGFHDRVKAGQLAGLTKGPVASKIKLADQYRLYGKGDVARRLGLDKHLAHPPHAGRPPHAPSVHHGLNHHGHHAGHHHGHHAGHFPYRGRISPAYTSSCFWFHHYGPWYALRHCWYPRWSHWLNWTWYSRPHPIWDPRPVYCRPIVYTVAPLWSYWDCPTWVSLPVVTSGTWVDVPQVIVAEQYDLQLLAVRFVDPGHPEQGLGPRYRVWFRNNTDQPITQSFNVAVLASMDTELGSDLPQAGVRVTAVEAGETQAVDVRLPIEVAQMGRSAAGEPVPFTTLHVLVDADRELAETSIVNNGARLQQSEILPVDPAAFEVQPSSAPAGGEVMLAGEGFGPAPGQVLVHLGQLEMEGEILGWYDLGVRLSLPNLPLAGATEAELIVIRADGAAANPMTITIEPPPGSAEVIPAPPVFPE